MQNLIELQELLGECHRCPLGDTRVNVVFGTGREDADVMFVGEAPGRNEDLKGEPFVGAAGKLLDELLASIGLDRTDVYIANILKCRPPGNRDPQPVEVETCTPFLREQVRLVSPRVIVTLGNYATRFVLGTTVGITKLRGTVQQTGRCTVLPIFHPAAALYDITKRDVLFVDFATIRTLIDEPDGGPACGSVVSGMSTVETSSAEQTRAAGRELASLLQPGDVIVLTGDLGAGKTVIAKGVAEGLGIAEPITSPTFNILLIHRGRLELAHFDLYRLESAAQLEDIDFWGVLESGAVSIVEWGDRFAGELPDDVLTVSLSITGDDSRTLKLAASGPRSAALASSWQRALAASGTAGEASARG